MVEISSDETSANETFSTNTILIINASKCIFCDKLLGYQGKFASDIKYHNSCLEDQKCIYCGHQGLNVLCKEKSCLNSFHLYCQQRSRKTCKNAVINCGFHSNNSKQKQENHLISFRKIASCIQDESSKLDKYKYIKGEIKASYFSHGQIFWGIIGSQYFTDSSRLQTPPVFSLRPSKNPVKASEKSWVGSAISSLTKILKKTKSQTREIFHDFVPKKQEKTCGKGKISEKDMLLMEFHTQKHRKFKKEFLKYLEINTKPRVPDKDDVFCEICMEDDYEEDDQIVSCNMCKVTVHVQCYGISQDMDKWDKWVCLSCLESNKPRGCALCPLTSGVLKPTVNKTVAQEFFNTQTEDRIWVHVFCALHADKNCIKDKAKIENIDLDCIEKKKTCGTCGVCGQTKGAFVKYNGARCKTQFHAECGKKNFELTSCLRCR